MSFISPKILLSRLGLRPRKAWGQHFLLYPHQARRIAAALEAAPQDLVVEAGPGLGALTVFLAQDAGKVVALERDPALCRYLQEELFPQGSTVEVRCQDVMDFSFLDLSREEDGPLLAAGNLPYQITSPLLFKLVREKAALKRAVFMVQREVGERLTAPPGTKDYGVLSVLIQYHFALTRLFSLGPANFFPAPQVDSVVLRLVPAMFEVTAQDETLFSRVVKAAFSQRRKTLNNTLAAQAAAFGRSQEELRAILKDLGIDPRRRGETLSVVEFVGLSNRILRGEPGDSKSPALPSTENPR
ncbi:MAG: ribosomal RNA small subunit methyltransferase A [Deltaproteobacteria bacterium]|nr:ribosomal RNA small subunit methyltransferase A [Deltaproteobacteria bacterium]